MMYSAEYEITLSNLVKLFTSVKYSIEFLMFDLLVHVRTASVRCRFERVPIIYVMEQK